MTDRPDQMESSLAEPRGPRSGVRRWVRKFRCAFRGLYLGTRGQDSFIIHVPVAALVLLVAAWLRLARNDWCLLFFAIGLVWSTELINSALEHLVRAVHPTHHPLLAEALDIASAAVLIAVITAISIGLLVLGPPLWLRLVS